jgi:hypothetical protein
MAGSTAHHVLLRARCSIPIDSIQKAILMIEPALGDIRDLFCLQSRADDEEGTFHQQHATSTTSRITISPQIPP